MLLFLINNELHNSDHQQHPRQPTIGFAFNDTHQTAIVARNRC